MDQISQKLLLEIARESINYGFKYQAPLPVSIAQYPPAAQSQQACFVTLTIQRKLRGCLGSLKAVRPLVTDVSHNAFSAAFRDPRFPKLSTEEYPLLHYHISVLNPPEPITPSSEHDLLEMLRPGVDGLILDDGTKRATFLPSVWENLSTPRKFLEALKQKAGWPAEHWAPDIRVMRYTTTSFESD